MDAKPDTVENRIISAAIDCIEKYGMTGTTTRQIAQTAGLNVAAINYYFRSKDILIQRCMEITLKNAFDLSDIPPMPGASASQRCITILTDIIQGGFRYPGITRAHFYNLVVEGQYDALLVAHFNHFIDALANDLHERDCDLSMDELIQALVQIVSAVFMAILTPSLIEQHGINLHDPEACLAYVTRLVNRLLV